MVFFGIGGVNGGGYVVNKYVVIGIYGGILLLYVFINSLSILWLLYFGIIVVVWNIFGMMIVEIVYLV